MARRLTYIVEPFSVDGRFWRKAVIKHRPIGAQTPRGTQISAARTRQNEHRAKHKFRVKRTLAKAAMLEKCQTHPPTRTCAILRGLIGGIYLVAEPWLGQRNCTQT
jgi:hypothetical protein